MIKIQDLSFSYSGKSIFEDFFLTFTSREFTALTGPNGSGKTTLLKLILGLLNPSDGTIFIEKKDLSRLKQRERASLLAYVPQTMESSYDFSLYETVMMGRYAYLKEWQKESREDKLIVERALDMMEISHLKNRSVNSVSGGERQRALIARALAQKTPLILLDEPTAFLDLRHQLAIMKLIRRITTEENITVIAVIHDLNLALNYADQAALLDKGKLIARGTPTHVLNGENVSRVYGVEARQINKEGSNFILAK